MSSLKTLELAITLAKRHFDEASQRLQMAEMACAQAQGQLQQLQSYQEETEQRWLLKGKAGMAQPIVMQSQLFRERLLNVIAMQQGVIAQKDEFKMRQKEAWQKTRQRLEILERHQSRQLDLMRKKQDRQEQKMLDEMAMVRFQARNGPLRKDSL